MKLKEASTPTYNPSSEPSRALTIEIPSLDLNGRYSASSSHPTSPTLSTSPTGADTSGPSSRRSSIASVGRPGASSSGRSGSANSSRSTSFNLPNDARGEIRSDKREPGEEVEVEEEMDEESMFLCVTITQPRLNDLQQPLRNMLLSFVLVEDIILTKLKL